MNISTFFRTAVSILALAATTICAQNFIDSGNYSGTTIQAFLNKAASGNIAYSVRLDFNKDGKIDLGDALLYGQWVNGLYHAPTLPALLLASQSDSAAFANYALNLTNRKNIWTPADLKNRYQDKSKDTSLSYTKSNVEYIDSLNKIFTSDTGFIAQVLAKGIAVSSHHAYPNFFTAFDAIHSADLPVIFTTDAMLYSLYYSYDNILMQLESNRFIPMLDSILTTSLKYCNRVYGNEDYAQDARDYLTTAIALLNPSRSNFAMSATVSNYLSLIQSQSKSGVTIFGLQKDVDFSQFKPRGHYTKTTALSNYFKAMMWLSRADLAFPLDTLARIQKGALVTWDCVVNSGAYPKWLEINRIIEYMVGTGDGLSVKSMGCLVRDLGGTRISTFVHNYNKTLFDSVLTKNKYGTQWILSEYKVYSNDGTDSLGLSPIFGFMPQRFILDSYTFSQSVFPLVNYRPLPSSNDIAFVLGDNSALQDITDLSIPDLPGILGSQRQLYDELSKQSWQSNMYTSWLNFLRNLNNSENNPLVSPVFKTSAWRAKMRNTQLMSWAHLRHNTILYAKQSYTGTITCQYPRAYVEPYPDFFFAVENYAQTSKRFFDSLDAQVSGYFSNVATISHTLGTIAQSTASGTGPSDADVAWLKQMVTSTIHDEGCASIKVFNGWYFNLLYENTTVIHGNNDCYYTIADVHTKPADDYGQAQVLHAATGAINLMATVIKLDTCTSVFVGPVGSFYDVITEGQSPIRMTDEEWKTKLQSTTPARPGWTSRFLY